MPKGKGKAKREEILDEFDINTIEDEDTEDIGIIEDEDKDNIGDDEDENLKDEIDNDIEELEDIVDPIVEDDTMDDLGDESFIEDGDDKYINEIKEVDEGDFSQQDSFGSKRISQDSQYHRFVQSILNQIRKAHKIKLRKPVEDVLNNEPYIY